MLWCRYCLLNLFQIAPLEDAVLASLVLNLMLNLPTIECNVLPNSTKNVHFMNQCRNWCNKGAGTKNAQMFSWVFAFGMMV